MSLLSHTDYIELTMHFRCNLKCEHCMIEGTMDNLRPESLARFQELLMLNRREHRWKGLILTGAEITLRRDLPELAKQARRHGFDRVRIQTHGMQLADRNYCDRLVEAGVNEYFVSIAGSDAATHDAITAAQGSFQRTMSGLENLDRYPHVVSLTNTVVTKRSYQQLPAIVNRLAHLERLVQMEFWNYWPMDEVDRKNLLVPYAEIVPFIRQAIAFGRRWGRCVIVKNFPECLLGEERGCLDNSQPKLIIDPAFWSEFMRNGFHQCVHRERCDSKQCLGLNSAYVRKFGWEAEQLRPLANCEAEGASIQRSL